MKDLTQIFCFEQKIAVTLSKKSEKKACIK